VTPTSHPDHRGLLATVPVFAPLCDGELDRLSRATTRRQLAAGQQLFRKGDPGTQLYAVLEGRVRVRVSSRTGRRITFETVGPGGFLGEGAVLDREPRSASVVALEPTRLLCVDRREVLACLRRNPEIALELALRLTSQVRRLSETLESQVFEKLSVRLARKLLQLAQGERGEPRPQGPVGLRLSQQELGELVGTSRESVNKQLRAWSSEGLLRYAGGRLTLLRPECFGRIASAG